MVDWPLEECFFFSPFFSFFCLVFLVSGRTRRRRWCETDGPFKAPTDVWLSSVWFFCSVAVPGFFFYRVFYPTRVTCIGSWLDFEARFVVTELSIRVCSSICWGIWFYLVVTFKVFDSFDKGIGWLKLFDSTLLGFYLVFHWFPVHTLEAI